MKFLATFIFLVCFFVLSSFSQSQDPVQISLKITYENNPLCNWDITIKNGDAAIGKGVTDANGFVKFEPSLIVSNAINVYGYKKTANGDKNWSVEGYVTLDDNYYHEMKMEVYAKEIADGAGFPMSAIADGWGVNVNCDGTIGTSSTIQQNPTNNTTTTNTTTTNTVVDPDQSLKDEKLKYENQLVDLTKKITTIETDLNQNRTTMSPVEIKLKELEKQELELRRDECKTAIERIDKSIGKTLTTDGLQAYTSKEQELKLKAEEIQKERTILLDLKQKNAIYAQQAHDYPIVVQRHKTELSGMTQLNKIDSINYKIKSLEMEEASYKYEASKVGQDRTGKQLENSLASPKKIYSDSLISDLQLKEDIYTQKAATTAASIQEQLRFKKEAEKEAKKEANQEKIDQSKLKLKIQSLKSQIGIKENALANEQKKASPDQVKMESLKNEIDELKRQQAELEKQIKL